MLYLTYIAFLKMLHKKMMRGRASWGKHFNRETHLYSALIAFILFQSIIGNRILDILLNDVNRLCCFFILLNTISVKVWKQIKIILTKNLSEFAFSSQHIFIVFNFNYKVIQWDAYKQLISNFCLHESFMMKPLYLKAWMSGLVFIYTI